MRSIRRKMWSFLYGRGKRSLLLPLLAWALLALVSCWQLSAATGRALLPPAPEQELGQLRRSRSLQHYLDNIELLIEPSDVCAGEEASVVVMVTSAPAQADRRDAVRRSWGSYYPTFFLMGLEGGRGGEQLINNYVEAKQYGDMVVFDFAEHYHNLTLKTALMLRWVRMRCSSARYLYKTDDDTLVNPWLLQEVLGDHDGAQLIGYARNNTWLHREEHNKWYLPRWLSSEDLVPQFLTGPGYLIRGDLIGNILQAAYKTPIHNIEDIYFTYNIAKRALGYALTHDSRLAPYRPWLPLDCAYWVQASIHSLTPTEVLNIWTRIAALGKEFDENGEVCQFYKRYLSRFMLVY